MNTFPVIVPPDNVVYPDTFNELFIVVTLFKLVFPEIFKVDMNVEGLLKLTNDGWFNIELYCKFLNAVPEPIVLPITFNELLIVDELETNKLVKLVLLNIDVDVIFKLFIDNIELVDKLFKLLKIVVDVLFKLLIFK